MIDMPTFAAFVAEHVGAASVRTIVEIGAYDGRDAAALRWRFPAARCIAIEGDAQNFRTADTRALIAQGVEWIQAIIGATDEPRTWWRQTTAPMISGLYNRALPGATPLPCQTMRFDTLADDINLETAHVVKIDVEGATYDVLCGMGTLLDTTRAMHIETETFPYFAGQVLEEPVLRLLHGRGFRCVAREGDMEQFDSVWVR